MRRLAYGLFLCAVAGSVGCASEGDTDGGPDTCVGKCDSPSGDTPWWSVNDVSIIVPLAKPGETELMPGVANADGGGALMSKDLWLQIDDAVPLTEGTIAAIHWPNLRVTSMRFDPCFEQTIPDTSCKRVVRLVAQPIEDLDGSGEVYAIDASLHLFYRLDDDQFVSMLLAYKQLIGERIPDALYQHPVLSRAGLGSELSTQFNQLISSNLGPDNMFRLTEMATGRSGKNWFWLIYERAEDGTYQRALVPTTPYDQDQFEISPRTPPQLNDIPNFPEKLLFDSYVDGMTEEELAQAATEIYAIENPAVVNSTNVKCSMCHVSGRILDYAFNRRGLPLPEDPSFVVPAGQNMGLRDEALSRLNMHGLGYFRTSTAVTRRVVKESAVVADFLNSDTFAETLSPSARAVWDAAREQ
ncbi:MAG: hypothetical protein AB7O24_13145 [Kofleriaceae bacterium]